MKKTKYFLVLFILIFCSGCNNKKTITSLEFKDMVRDENLYVINTIDQFKDYDYILESYIGRSSKYKYEIEFYILKDSPNSLAFYNLNKELFEANEDSESIISNSDSKKSNKYTLLNETSYKVISRIENTVVYVDSIPKNKDTINKVLNKLGY